MSDQKGRPTSAKLRVGQHIRNHKNKTRHPRNVPSTPHTHLAKLVADILDELDSKIIARFEQALVARLDALLAAGFTPQKVFYAARWTQLQPQFQRYREELGDVSYEEAWHSLARPALLEALSEMPEDLQGAERYHLVRRKVQHYVERYLMDGLTTDSRREESLELLSEPDLPDEADIGRGLGQANAEVEQIVEIGEVLREFQSAFTPEELELLQAQYGDATALAAKYGISRAALWKRMERARRKLRAWRSRYEQG